MKTRLISVAVIAILAIAATSAAQHQAPGPRVLAAYLQLTPDQIAAWKQIHTDTAAAIEPLATQARELRMQIAAATDPSEIGKLTLSLRSVRDQIRTAREASKGKLIAVLTPEQKTKFEAFEAAAKSLRRRRH